MKNSFLPLTFVHSMLLKKRSNELIIYIYRVQLTFSVFSFGVQQLTEFRRSFARIHAAPLCEIYDYSLQLDMYIYLVCGWILLLSLFRFMTHSVLGRNQLMLDVSIIVYLARYRWRQRPDILIAVYCVVTN